MTRIREEVAHLVQKALRHVRSNLGHASIRVVPERIEPKSASALNHEWWIVPVEVSVARPQMYRYYEVLDAVKQHLEESESLDVLLGAFDVRGRKGSVIGSRVVRSLFGEL